MRRHQPAKGSVAAIARKGADDPGCKGRIEPGEDIGRDGRPFRDQECDEQAFGRGDESAPHVGIFVSDRRAEQIVDLRRRKGLGKKDARLTGVAEEIGADRKIGGELLHQPIQRRGGHRAEPGGSPGDDPQIGRIKKLQEAARRRRAQHKQERRGPFRSVKIAGGCGLGHYAVPSSGRLLEA